MRQNRALDHGQCSPRSTKPACTGFGSIGARTKVVPEGDGAPTVYRHVNSGSSCGGNPLRQTIGLGPAKKIARLEVHWSTSGTTQVFPGSLV